MNAISSKLSRNLDNNHPSSDKVKWMLGAPLPTSPTANPQPVQDPNMNNTTNHSSCEKYIEEDYESSVDSANATEAKRIQSIKYSKM